MIELTCGKCVWMQKVEIPEEKKEKYKVGRGYCTFNPPQVFPMPQQKTSNIAMAQGRQAQAQMEFLPYMMRPVVEDNEPMCGRFSPNEEAMKELGIDPENPAGGCRKEGGCEC